MVDTVDGGEEHPSVIPSSSTADGGSSVSREEFNTALDTLKTSMTAEVKGMFKEYLEGFNYPSHRWKWLIPLTRWRMLTPKRGKLIVIKFLCLVVEVGVASLPMLNHLLPMEDRFPPRI
jgi:hypothetical protein